MENEILILIINLLNLQTARGEFKGHIVGGNFSKIEDFPYSAFLSIQCHLQGKVHHFICSSSIVNQAILLTAAHCLEDCSKGSTITGYAGNVNKYNGQMRLVLRFIIHEKYDPLRIVYDIALVRLNSVLEFGKDVGRVAVSPKPPYFELAQVAGWGVTDDTYKTSTLLLKHVNQTVWQRSQCLNLVSNLHRGAFCAGGVNSRDHAAPGDSGSALVVRKYIQIGLVSYTLPKISKSIVIYTDVGYFFYWIRLNTGSILCPN